MADNSDPEENTFEEWVRRMVKSQWRIDGVPMIRRWDANGKDHASPLAATTSFPKDNRSTKDGAYNLIANWTTAQVHQLGLSGSGEKMTLLVWFPEGEVSIALIDRDYKPPGEPPGEPEQAPKTTDLDRCGICAKNKALFKCRCGEFICSSCSYPNDYNEECPGFYCINCVSNPKKVFSIALEQISDFRKEQAEVNLKISLLEKQFVELNSCGESYDEVKQGFEKRIDSLEQYQLGMQKWQASFLDKYLPRK